MNIFKVGAQYVRRALLSDSTIAMLVDNGQGVYKVYSLSAPSYVEFPYIRIDYISGSKANDSGYNRIDVILEVTAVGMDAQTVMTISDNIERVLADKLFDIEVGTYSAYAPIRNVGAVVEDMTTQNFQYIRVGGQYRIRMEE